MKELKRAGNNIYILTGAIASNISRNDRRNQLDGLGISPELYDDIAIANGINIEDVGRIKGEFCRDNNIDMLFEDMDVYIRKVNELSPQTSTWLVRRF